MIVDGTYIDLRGVIDRGRRWKQMSIDYRVLGELMIDRARIIESTIPRDAKCVSVHWDVQRQMFQFIYEHPDFEIVPEGEKIPYLDLPTWRTYVKGEVEGEGEEEEG